VPSDPPVAGRRRGAWLRAVRAVAKKELLETRRDRRTLIAAVLLPAVTMPLVVLAMPLLAQRQQQEVRDRPARVAVVGAAAAALAASGTAAASLRVVAVANPRRALLEGAVEVVIEETGAAGQRPRRLVVLFDESRPASAAAVNKVVAAAARLAQDELEAALRARGTTTLDVLTSVVEPRSLASPERMGGALLATVLPFFVAIWLLLGGQYAALDVGVGERERGSLEALLVTPPARSALVTGKFLAVLVPALLALAVMLLAATASLAAGGGFLPSGPVRIALLPVQVGLVGVVGFALAALLSAAQLVVSLAARTLREAQQAFAGLYLIVAVPSMLVALLDGAPGGRAAGVVPVLNAAAALRQILIGWPDAGLLVATTCSLVVLAAATLVWGSRLLHAGFPNR
jgi:sodium transport system permease protein